MHGTEKPVHIQEQSIKYYAWNLKEPVHIEEQSAVH